jgi:hypothetical protein
VRYAVTLADDDKGTVLVTVPDLPEAITFGEDAKRRSRAAPTPSRRR